MVKLNHVDGTFGINVDGMTQTLEPTTVDRIPVYKVSPELYEAMMVLSNAAAKDIDPELAELIRSAPRR
jgi:hypothetical protein